MQLKTQFYKINQMRRPDSQLDLDTYLQQILQSTGAGPIYKYKYIYIFFCSACNQRHMPSGNNNQHISHAYSFSCLPCKCMFSETQDVQRLKFPEAQVRKREELQPVAAEPFLFSVVELSEVKSIDELVLYSL